MAETQPHTIRFPVELHQQIKKRAEISQRSFNGQVIHMCEDYLAQGDSKKEINRPGPTTPGPAKLAKRGTIADLVRSG